MYRNHIITLDELNFTTLHHSERRTALHISEFAGHEKCYRFSILEHQLEIIWRKGQAITFIHDETEDADHFELESVDPVEYMFLRLDGLEHEIKLPHACLEAFCAALDQVQLKEAVSLEVPLELERLLNTKRGVAINWSV